MAINFYEDLTVYNHVYVEGGFYAGNPVDTNYDLKIKGASFLQNTLTVSGIVTLSSVANAASDPNKFLCVNGSNQVEYRTGAQVLSDIGAASSSSLSNYLPLAGGTMTGTTSHGDNVQSRFGTGNDLSIFAFGTTSVLDIPAGDFYIGDYQTFDTGSFVFARVSGESGLLQAEEGWFALRANGTSNHVFIGSDGSDVVRIDNNSMLLYDNMKLEIGTGSDLQIYHGGTNSVIDNITGDLIVTNFQDDGDIKFLSDDGSGGTTEYFRLDGVRTVTVVSKDLEILDNVKAKFGTSSDLEIYHNGSNSIIEDTGTGDLVLKFSNDLLIEGQDGANLINCNEGNSVQLYYNGSEKLETKSTGIEVTGDVLDRDIPCLFNSNFLDGTGSSIYVVPFNSLSEVTISSRTYYHNLTMPYAGKLVKVVMKNVSGTLGSGFTTQLFLYVNGSQQASSAELSIVNSAVTWTPTTSNTFSAGDELSFAYQKSAAGTGITWAGVSFGVAIELTDYDI